MHAMQIDPGGKDVGIVRQPHRGEVAAVGSAPQADSFGIHIRQGLQIFPSGQNIFVLGAAARPAIDGLAKVPSIHYAGPIIDREHT